ncbi:MAG: prepilin-type N-terminal cleavage/methylation domain-containing protein [Acidobacteria bacterium]|nr:prepilin-type N-terminal cleavage/methylation domain-containing protein [Acidobacteriota bacterium]
MKREEGFSLIELLIVVGIILIIAAIAIPNLLQSKMAANEASAAAALRTIATANLTYSSTYNVGFAGGLTALGPPAGGAAIGSAAADLIDSSLGVDPATKSGYVFTYLPINEPAADSPNGSYSATATPVSLGASGKSTFCIDKTNKVGKDVSGATVAGADTGCDFAADKFSPM